MVEISTPAVISQQLEELRQRYLDRLPAQLDELTRLTETLEGTTADLATLETLHQHLHKLAGSAGSFGQEKLGSAARTLEIWISNAIQQTGECSPQALLMDIKGLYQNIDKTQANKLSPFVARANTQKRRNDLWVLEPDLQQSRDLAKKLSPFNYETTCFDRLSVLLDTADKAPPDFLIIDTLILQEIDDDTQWRLAKLQQQGAQLVATSDEDNFSQRVQAVNLGALGFHLRPLNIPKLVARLEQGAARIQSPTERVLIIEDDKSLAEHYQLILQLAGMQVQILDRAENLIEALNSLRPDLVLMDLHMPNYSGPDLAGVIRQFDHWTGLPIVYVSAETDLALQVHALNQGADDFLTKPVSDAQLLASVRTRIHRARVLSAQIDKDSLTGLLKHAAIKEAVEQELQRSQRTGQPVVLAMIDIDHFKSVNDTFGHATGDAVISAIATLLNQRLRQSDLVGRYGGEEFLAVLPNCSLANAKALIDNIRERFSEVAFNVDDEQFSCTFSAGVTCTVRHQMPGASMLLAQADMALYRAKRSGRNCVCAAGDP